ncbi:helix-turn-helix domain-containing protein [Nocardia farcinica]|uniref:Anaerobic benzoate catabolism transcriptional regulator n=1 Tax=Nocardia farcinica TaxID=37329 RepID=A0A0H5NDN9_NOCFR|nr:helix-turn-helix transcriptional regulator [Nocardia farcinica]AXK88683.1 transcriptional regulator [Nocardia farcinica]MBA4858394.1 helix-turn-helix domain-containing protein [Nocardia farcinica]MBC9818363.1 helix-turn-helix domain-containing protein [Nocardia farcinica]MBF6070947.1 helix-turn-helix domain-containing protein [Nocardia farcinica]MBF6139692.1 helix-turn-helix domain-containing protein [Nocardia farcinica]
MTLLREAIGDSLRRARLAQHRTLREVSTSARVSLGYLSEVERGRKEASSELLAAICDALDVPLSRVLWDVSTIMAGTDAVPVEEPAATEPTPHEEAATAEQDAPVGEPAGATMSAAGAVRPQIDEDTRIVIPAPTADMLVLVKSN